MIVFRNRLFQLLAGSMLVMLFSCEDDDSGAFSPINPNAVNVTTTLSGDSEIIQYNPQIGSNYNSVLDDGTQLQLQIQPDPFDENDRITLTGELISAVNNLPGGLTSPLAINFGPTGFEFYNPAILIINLQQSITNIRGYSISNGQFRLIPIQVSSSGLVTMSISHFSDVGLIVGDAPIEEIANPVTADDYKHNIAVNQGNQDEVDKWLEEWKDKFIDPRLASVSTLESVLEVMVTVLEFASNKQMIGVADVSEELNLVRQLISNGIEILEMECNVSDCNVDVLNSLPRWIVASQYVGSEIDISSTLEKFCNGELLTMAQQISIQSNNTISISESREESYQLSLTNLIGNAITSSSSFEDLQTSSNDPNIAAITVSANDQSINVQAISEGATFVFVEDPCTQAKDSLFVEVLEAQIYSGTATVVFEDVQGSISRNESWQLTIEAEFRGSGESLDIVDATISGIVDRENTSCNLQGDCVTTSDQQTFACEAARYINGVIEWNNCSQNQQLQIISLSFEATPSETELAGELLINSRFTVCEHSISIPIQ